MLTTPAAVVPPKATAYSDNPSSERATVGIAVATATYSKATNEINVSAPRVNDR
ncbi:hypothetical protein AB0I53_43330 [Saccharopolyspora sp. NPDC050389]|uniref:hypothetical protein n=1 Tax=Saccharopolyspora sp. NPDC050389 TaxID=3155516 RepID=UPI00340C4948